MPQSLLGEQIDGVMSMTDAFPPYGVFGVRARLDPCEPHGKLPSGTPSGTW